MESPIQVLYDGWPLIYHPSSPSAIHLWDILNNLPEGTGPILVLPDEAPEWIASLEGVRLQIHRQENSPAARLRWEQRTLLQLAVNFGASLVHLTHGHPALRTGVTVLVSPTGPDEIARDGGIAGRLRSALGRGGMASGARVLWPEDLPAPDGQTRGRSLSPFASPGCRHSDQLVEALVDQLDLPETFILYAGSLRIREVRTVLEAWVWGAGALGDYFPLLLLGAREAGGELTSLLERYGFGEAVQTLPSVPPPGIPALYRRASALIHPGVEPPWGGSLRLGLACGVPVVTMDHPPNGALVGGAAFAVPVGDTRKLGAGLITVIVEEDVAQKLSTAALRLTAGWNPETYRRQLGEVYGHFS